MFNYEEEWAASEDAWTPLTGAGRCGLSDWQERPDAKWKCMFHISIEFQETKIVLAKQTHKPPPQHVGGTEFFKTMECKEQT